MLHCPRCSGPLDVQPDMTQQNNPFLNGQIPRSNQPSCSPGDLTSQNKKIQQEEKQRTIPISCPAGHLCPHSTVKQNQSLNYLSGGNVFVAGSNNQSKPSSTTATSDASRSQTTTITSPASTSLWLPSQTNTMSQNPTLLISQTSSNRAPLASSNPIVNLPVQESPFFLTTTLASVTSSGGGQQQQPQHSHQTANPMMAPLSAPTGMISSFAPQTPHQPAQIFVDTPRAVIATTAALNSIYQQQNPNNAATPVFLTSTINNHPGSLSFQSTSWVSTLSQPPTPAIVVGSTAAPPFFSSTNPFVTEQQQNNMPLVFPMNTVASSDLNARHIPDPLEMSQQVSRIPNVESASSTQEILMKNRNELNQCEWYYPDMKWNESSEVLAHTSPGTFLVRDSANLTFLFSLSVQREEGPTSVRIHFHRNRFSLDAEDSIQALMPKFSSVIELIDHYRSSNSQNSKEAKNVLVDGSDTCSKTGLPLQQHKVTSPITLKSSLLKKVPSLSHWCRIAINTRLMENGAVTRTDELNLPTRLVTFLKQYPHKV